MWGLLLAAVIMAGMFVAATADGRNVLVLEIVGVFLISLLLIMGFRPKTIRDKEHEELINDILKWRDQQRIVHKCKGCINIESAYNTCRVYSFPWEAWRAHKKCPDFSLPVQNDTEDIQG